ncbi:hypothetical protein [Paraburkholderia sp. UCT2]|uniref:hypothetical protein n=1 Tax=Paraburkholderia sp. UCT2 TaxID=2615208 RepID=UPI00223C21CE|nr:hypothetical protein [Paraburkholderia sp. UCT2]
MTKANVATHHCVEDIPAELELVAAIEQAFDRVEESVKAQHRQQTAVEHEHERLDVLEAVLEASTALLPKRAPSRSPRAS